MSGAMASYAFETVDVFTSTRFGGNPLAVFTDARLLSDAQMQALAAEMNLSETCFVLPPTDPANNARVRIFNRTAEMPFAGHPNVGTAFVLARQLFAGADRLRFEEMAGLVEVRLLREAGEIVGAEIDAPQPLTIHGELPSGDIAACLGLAPEMVLTVRHKPVRASVGVDFVLAEVAAEALPCALPDLSAFRRAAVASGLEDRLSVFFYAPPAQGPLRARMFAPLSGTWEDPATGSANATLAAFLLSLGGEREIAYEAIQGVEMGRPSRLNVRAWREAGGVRASVGGRCVPVLAGTASL
jgi:trans-2,3-dihydro-3-hydroxyanthranilate isomerase